MENNKIRNLEISPTSLKIPKELKEKIRKRAEENRRSLNQEIIFMIEKYYEFKEVK